MSDQPTWLAGAPGYLLVGVQAGSELALLGTAHAWEQAMEGAFVLLDNCPGGVLVIDINNQRSKLVKHKNPLFDRKDHGHQDDDG